MQSPQNRDLHRLLTANARDLRVNGKATQRSIAAAFYQGLIDCQHPSNTAPLAAFMAAEGSRRVPAFVFESLFVRELRLSNEVSESWHVCQPRNPSAPSIWFKLLSDDRGWSDLDESFSQRLISRDVHVWKSWYKGNQLFLAPADNENAAVSAREFIELNPCDMPVHRGEVRNMLAADELPMNALRMLEEAGKPSIDQLIRSRVFINCFLELAGGRPFDVDAICRNRSGQIFATEFKRKYPSRHGFLGIDQHLLILPRLLEDICPLHHFVLLDRRGRGGKGNDPTCALLEEGINGPNFEWLVLLIEPNSQDRFKKVLQTTGLDSGQRGGVREQIAIPRSAFSVLKSLQDFELRTQDPA